MELIKQNWTNLDAEDFQAYLKSLARPEKCEWTRRIINTNMPLLAIATPTLKNIAKEIFKGNYISFLNLHLNEYYENTIVNASLISKITDFNTFKNYLTNYAERVDNWASCDLLDFKITKQNAEDYFNLSKTLTASTKTFKKRIGILIWFKLIEFDEFFPKILQLCNNFYNETEYYVNMVLAWFVAECFIKRREETLKYLNSHKLNKFTINKAVQKCRDSYRVTKEDKDMLLSFKIK